MSFFKLSKRKRIFKNILCVVLVLVTFLSSVLPSFAASLSSLSNGSPILSASATRTMTERDHIAMALYMSSCVYPGVDNYFSAFDENTSSGSEGKAASKLNIRNDTSGGIKKYMETFMSAQIRMADGKTASADKKLKKGDTNNDVVVSDIISPNSVMYSRIAANSNFSGEIKAKVPGSTEDFVVFGGAGEQLELCKTAIDIACAIGQKAGGSKFGKNINKYSNKPLFLDCFGNICIDTGLEAKDNSIILIPNYLNPYCLSSEGNVLNLLGSLVFDEIGNSIVIGSFGGAQKWDNLGNTVKITMKIADILEKDRVHSVNPKQVIHSYYSVQDNTNTPIDFLSGVGGYYKLIFKEQNDKDLTFTTEGLQSQYNYCIFLNYLLLSQTSDFPTTDSTGAEVFETFKFYAGTNQIKLNANIFDISGISSSLADAAKFVESMTEDEKKTFALDSMIEWIRDPAKAIFSFASGLAKLLDYPYRFFAGLNKDASGVDTAALGFSTINDFPFLGPFYDFVWKFLPFVILFLLVVCSIIGCLVSKSKFTDILIKVLLATALITLLTPKLFNVMSMGFDKLVSIVCSANEQDWILAFNMRWDKQTRSNSNAQAQQLMAESTYFSESGLNYIQEKSPVVVNNTSDEIYTALSQSGLGSMFLGAILKQYVNGSEVSSDIGDLNKRLIMLSPLYEPSNSGDTAMLSRSCMGSNYFEAKFANRAVVTPYYTDSQKSSKFRNWQVPMNMSPRSANANHTYWYGGHVPAIHYFTEYDSDTADNHQAVVQGNLNRVNTEIIWHAVNTNKAANGVDTPEILKLHNNFYFLSDSLSTNGLKNIYSAYFSKSGSAPSGVSKISKFNYYSSDFNDTSSTTANNSNGRVIENTNYNNAYSYFINTENIIPYFYSVWWDLFATSSVRDIGYLVQGEVESSKFSKAITDYTTDFSYANQKINSNETTSYRTLLDADGKEVYSRNSILMKKSHIVDYVDLEELFTNVIPYCNAVTDTGREAFKNEFIKDDWELYKDNKKSWLFDCNWAVKLYELYKDQLYDSNGKFIPTVLGRQRYWSECDVGNNSEITLLEGQILEFYNKLTPHVETLMTRVNDSKISKGAIIRYLALATALEFNRTFSSPGCKLYPQYIDAGSITVDTLWNDLFEANNYNVSVLDDAMLNLHNNGLGFIGGIILLIATIGIWLLRIVRIGILVTFCFGSILTILANVCFRGTTDDMIKIGVGILFCFLKLVVLFTLPTLFLLLCGNNSVFIKAQLSPIIWMIFVIILCYFDIRISVVLCMQHLGFTVGADGKMHFDPANLMTLGGERTMENIGNFGKSVVGGAMLKSRGKKMRNEMAKTFDNLEDAYKAGLGKEFLRNRIKENRSRLFKKNHPKLAKAEQYRQDLLNKDSDLRKNMANSKLGKATKFVGNHFDPNKGAGSIAYANEKMNSFIDKYNGKGNNQAQAVANAAANKVAEDASNAVNKAAGAVENAANKMVGAANATQSGDKKQSFAERMQGASYTNRNKDSYAKRQMDASEETAELLRQVLKNQQKGKK